MEAEVVEEAVVAIEATVVEVEVAEGPNNPEVPSIRIYRQADMSTTAVFTPIPIPNISKDALTIPNTNTNFLMSP